MVRWQPARKDVLDALAAEILQNYSSGRVLVAVDGDSTAGTAYFADGLAEALTAAGHVATRATEPADADRIRAFSASSGAESGAGMLVVDGPHLLAPALAGLWHFSVWVEGLGAPEDTDEQNYVREFAPRAKASAIIENRDPLHPRRSFADSC